MAEEIKPVLAFSEELSFLPVVSEKTWCFAIGMKGQCLGKRREKKDAKIYAVGLREVPV